MIRVILRNVWWATLAAGFISLAGCSTYTPPPPQRPAAAPVDTKALSGHLTKAQAANLSAAQRNKRMRQIALEDDKFIKSFP